MYKLFKTIIMIIGLNSTLGAANLTWVPILMGDITTFVPYSSGNGLPLPIKTVEDTYSIDEIVSIIVNTPLSGDEDWVGIYKVDDNNDWSNVIAWNWVEQGNTVLNRDQKPMPAGEYEIRLFFHNSTSNVEAIYRFTVVDNTREFGTEGPYLNKVKSVKTSEDGKVTNAIYYVEGVDNLPTVIYMSGWKSNLESYDGFLKYIASLGYCVIAKSERGKCFTPNVYEEELITQLTMVRDTYNADIAKLGMIGHSSGGGTVHYLMDYFKSNHIAGNIKSVTMSIDGWFPFGTTKELLNNFDTPTLLIQFGGFDGINNDGIHPDWDDYAEEPYHHYQDPKVNLGIFKSLTHANTEKEYIVLEANNNHSYVAGNYNTIMTRQDILSPIDEFLNHTLGTGDAMNLINQYDDVILNDLVSEYQYYCHTSGFNFCDLDNLVFP
jgi:dienelactone hydrolase